MPAIKNNQLFEIKSSEILQPGPAALTDGVEKLHKFILGWDDMAPTLVASRTALPPEGAVPPKGGLSAGRVS